MQHNRKYTMLWIAFCLPKTHMWKSQPLVPQKRTLLRGRVFSEVIKLK